MNKMSQSYHSNRTLAWKRPGGTSSSNNIHVNSNVGGSSRKRPHSPPNHSVSTQHISGQVTKLADTWGVIDKKIFFRFNICERVPKMNEYVTAQAQPTSSGNYKFRATKVFIQKQSNTRVASSLSHNDSLDAKKSGIRGGRNRRNIETDHKRFKRDNIEDRHRESDKHIQRDKDHHKFVNKKSSTINSSTKRKSTNRYNVVVPKEPLILNIADETTLNKRYPTLYIPSDFSSSIPTWHDSFGYTSPFNFDAPCNFHIVDKKYEAPTQNNAVYRPADADYAYSSKVMLVSIPDLEEIHRRTISEDDRYTPLSRLVQFLTGSTQGKNNSDLMAIGGPWSPSLDGENPETDPTVLIRTAIRTCLALTGIDLTACSRWFRFMEMRYFRSDKDHHHQQEQEKSSSPSGCGRVETVVYFVPQMWSCVPSCLDWEKLVHQYDNLAEKLETPPSDNTTSTSVPSSSSAVSSAKPVREAISKADTIEVTISTNAITTKTNNNNETTTSQTSPSVPTDTADSMMEDYKEEDLVVIDKCEDRVEPTHYSHLEPQNMKMDDLKQELEARSLSTKGLKPQLAHRLELALRKEKDAETESTSDVDFLVNFTKIADEPVEVELKVVDEIEESMDDEKPSTVVDEPVDESMEQQQQKHLPSNAVASGAAGDATNEKSVNKSNEKTNVSNIKEKGDSATKNEKMDTTDEPTSTSVQRKYVLPKLPHIIVHPSRTAKGGKYECQVTSLTQLLCYRENDIIKESAFELHLFAQFFHEMLMRDFGFTIYKALTQLSKKDDKPVSESTNDSSVKDKNVTEKENQDENVEKDQMEEDSKSDVNESGSVKDSASEMNDIEDRSLLLAFSFFDRSRSGFIFDKDLSSLLQNLGLCLSRKQVKELVQNACAENVCRYRQLLNKGVFGALVNDLDIEPGNRLFESPMSKFGQPTAEDYADGGSDDRMVEVDGSYVNVQALVNLVKKNEADRIEAEKKLITCKSELESLKRSLNSSVEKQKQMSDEAKYNKERLSVLYKQKAELNSHIRNYAKSFKEIKNTISCMEKAEVAINKRMRKEDDRPLNDSSASNENENNGNIDVVTDSGEKGHHDDQQTAPVVAKVSEVVIENGACNDDVAAAGTNIEDNEIKPTDTTELRIEATIVKKVATTDAKVKKSN